MLGDVLKRLRDNHMTDLFNDPALPVPADKDFSGVP